MDYQHKRREELEKKKLNSVDFYNFDGKGPS